MTSAAVLTPMLVRLKALVFRRRIDAELDEELRFHLDREVERNVARGMPLAEARDAARRAFGNVTVATEQAREAWRWRGVESLAQDSRYALRAFTRAPGFALTVIATIGLGLGLLSAAFTFFDAYALRPLAVRDPWSLYGVSWTSANGAKRRFTVEQFSALRRERGVFAEAYAYTGVEARVRGRPAMGEAVGTNYFEMLGVPPAMGRTLVRVDDERPDVLVLSHHMWRTVFGGDTSVIGTRVNLNGSQHTIVGVAREGFGGLTSAPFDFWVPLVAPASAPAATTQALGSTNSVSMVARLAPGVSPARANALVLARLKHETADVPPLERANAVTLLPKATSLSNDAETIGLFAPIVTAFGLVLLIACANVANLMLARGMARQREIGIRLALGAGRARLIRQLLTEAVVLALPAGALGFVVSRAAIWISLHVMFSTVPPAYAGYLRVIPLDASARVLAFAMIAALGAALAFGLAPALNATRPNIVQTSRGDFDTQFRPSRMRSALLVSQIVMSVLLLVCAGVLLTGARHTERLDPGIRTKDVVQIQLHPRFRAPGIEALRASPDVRDLASASSTPLDGYFNETMVVANGRPAAITSYLLVSPGYFSVLELPLLRGRGFTDDEARSRAPVAVITASTAARFWPNADAIGQTLTLPPTNRDFQYLASYHEARVVGITRDAVPGWIGADRTLPIVYYPQPLDARVNQLLARVSGDAERARASLERTLAAVDSGAVVEMHTLESSRALQVYPFRAMFWVATAVGGIALVLTLIGVYSVMSYLVAQRRKEFGIRLALGAAAASLVALVLRQSMRLALIGVSVGLALALAMSRVIASFVSNFQTFSALAYGAGALLVLLACLVAAYVPARRAALVDPVKSLRTE